MNNQIAGWLLSAVDRISQFTGFSQQTIFNYSLGIILCIFAIFALKKTWNGMREEYISFSFGGQKLNFSGSEAKRISLYGFILFATLSILGIIDIIRYLF